MSNFPPLPSYPWGLYSPIPHGDMNKISEQMVKTVNAADGSSHAPTGTIAWSGVNGHGFSFDTVHPFPFFGKLDVTSTLRFDVGGAVQFGQPVSVDIFGPVTLYNGFSASLDVKTGVHATFESGSFLDVNGTTNLNGATAVRGTMTITLSGGPGSVVFQNTTTLVGNAGAHATWSGVFDFSGSGSKLRNLDGDTELDWAGPVNFNGSTVTGDGASTLAWSGAFTQSGASQISGVWTWSGSSGYQVLRQATGPNGDGTVDLWHQDTLLVPDLTATCAWTLAPPPGNAPVDAVIHWPTQTLVRVLTIVDGNTSTTLFEHDISNTGSGKSLAPDGTVATLRLRYNGSQWVILTVEKGPRVFNMGAGSDATCDAWKYDVIVIGTQTSSQKLTLNAAPAGLKHHPVYVRRADDASGFITHVWNAAVNLILELNTTGGVAPIGVNGLVDWDGSNWFPLCRIVGP